MQSKEIYILVSGGFDPIHSGHIAMFNDARKHGKLIVIINNDNFLLKKKGFIFMPHHERTEVIKNLKSVDEVVLAIDDDFTVVKTIEHLSKSGQFNIKYFANGGDRKNSNDIPEADICAEHGIELIFNIGGNKTQSSSSLVHNLYDNMSINRSENNIIPKPWGKYENFIQSEGYLLKKITINPKESLSEQIHNFRNEHWVIVEGSIEIELDGGRITANTYEHVMVSRNQLHRIHNPYNKPAVIVEIQYGPIIDEEDIKRTKDKYGR